MCEMNVTKEELDLIIGRLQDAIKVCHTAPDNTDEGWPYATGFARSAMQGAVEDLQRLM
jgi:hypothetical protein|tara:strand:- start:1332 stop:1508 length:177 start_codon:yes stop_codon:yes gene_type:complete